MIACSPFSRWVWNLCLLTTCADCGKRLGLVTRLTTRLCCVRPAVVTAFRLRVANSALLSVQPLSNRCQVDRTVCRTLALYAAVGLRCVARLSFVLARLAVLTVACAPI